ncbi:MAG: hypothetical protein ACT4NX_09675 [Deltaproteobacteria bacterium]
MTLGLRSYNLIPMKDAPIIDLNQYKFEQADKELRAKLVEFSRRPEIQAQIGEAFYIWKGNASLVKSKIREDQIDDLTFTRFFDWFIYDFKLLDSGKRVIEAFGEGESENLSKIERALLGEWAANIHSFFEVEEVTANKGFTGRDIFTGEALRISEAAAGQISAGSIVEGRALKTGSSCHFASVIMVYPAPLKPLILDFFQNEFREYRKTFGSRKSAKEYLKDWGFLISHFVEEAAKNPKFLTPDGDALIFASATYSVENYAKALREIRKIPSLEEIKGGTDDLRVFSWRRGGGAAELLGSIELEPDKLLVQCHSAESLSKIKNLIDETLKDAITYIADKIATPDASPKIKSPRKKRKSAADKKPDSEFDAYYDEWVHKPLGDLDGKTPNEAAGTKSGRQKLESILDELESLYNYSRDHGEPYFDVTKLRRKLGIE